MWPYNGEMSGTAYGENCIGVAEYNSLENVTISGNRIEYKADAVPQVDWDAGYGSSIHIGNSNLGGSHNTMRNVTVRCNTTRLEQANVDAFQHWGNAGIGIENAAVGDELNEPYDAALASSLCQVSDNLFENLTVEYNDFDVNCFNLRNISLVGTAQVGTNNNFRNIRIEHNRIRSVKGLHVFGASGTSNMGCEAEGALENLTISDNEILALRKTGWSAESSINSSGEQDDYGIQLIGASVADLDGASWDEPGEPAAWDKLQAKVSGIAIDSNRVTGFANGILVAAAECGRTHYVTGIPVDGVKILDNEIKTDAQLTAEEKAAADQAAADEVAALIDEIGGVEYTDECKAKIDEARAAYDALTDEQKELVENYEVLTAAEEKYAELKAEAEKSDEPETPDEPAKGGKIHGDRCFCYDYEGDGLMVSIVRFLCAFFNFFLNMRTAIGA